MIITLQYVYKKATELMIKQQYKKSVPQIARSKSTFCCEIITPTISIQRGWNVEAVTKFKRRNFSVTII